jgi:DNA-binding IclR family transcriptional regulator
MTRVLTRDHGQDTGTAVLKQNLTWSGRSVPAKLLGLLAAFGPDRQALSVTELSRRSGLPLTTTHRLVGELTSWGALERGADGLYRVGLRLVEIASLCPRGIGLRDAALPYLEDLYEATHQNIQLAVRDGLDAVYVERIAGRLAIAVRTQVGARWPLHATGVGLALLAHAPTDVQERVFASPLTRFTTKTVDDHRTLRRMLAEARRTGLAVSDGQVTLDAYSVAAPVRGPRDVVVAAVSIVVPADDPRRLGWGPAVRAAARGISRALGAPSAVRRPAAG